jgi:hypothetical protein
MVRYHGPCVALRAGIRRRRTGTYRSIWAVKTAYPTAPQAGPMYNRYVKEKAGKRELWYKMRDRILTENRKQQ